MEWTLYFEISSSVFILCTFAFATWEGEVGGVYLWKLRYRCSHVDPTEFQTIFQRGSLFLTFSFKS